MYNPAIIIKPCCMQEGGKKCVQFFSKLDRCKAGSLTPLMPLGMHQRKPGKQKQRQAPGSYSAEISQRTQANFLQSDILKQIRKEDDNFHIGVIKIRCQKKVMYGEQLLIECARVYMHRRDKNWAPLHERFLPFFRFKAFKF